MKLWILSRTDRVGYDEYGAHAVLALTEETARKLAANCPGDEGPEVWLDSTKSVCELISLRGKVEELLLSEYRAG